MTLASSASFRATPHFREKRRRGMARVTLTDATGQVRPIMVRDVSAKGLSAAIQGDPPAIDAMVSVQLPDGTVAWGVIRWVERNLFGVEFDTTPQHV
jgi:hypothetical protein